jgi:hypothetical protein
MRRRAYAGRFWRFRREGRHSDREIRVNGSVPFSQAYPREVAPLNPRSPRSRGL